MFYEKPLTLKQVARKLQVSVSTIPIRIRDYNLPISHNSRRWAFSKNDLVMLMDHFKSHPKSSGKVAPGKLSFAECAKLGAQARWNKKMATESLENLKPFKPGQSCNPNGRPATYNRIDDVSVWLIKHGHAEAGIALLTEYRP